VTVKADAALVAMTKIKKKIALTLMKRSLFKRKND
jgi:hypothetical protein